MRGTYKRPKPAGTIAALADAYRQSPRWQGWTPHTRGHADRVLHRLCAKHGGDSVYSLTRGRLQQAVDTIAARDGYGAARHWLRIVGGMLDFAVRYDWTTSNPARYVEKPKPPKHDGHRTWRDDEIAAFLSHHAPGSVAHTVATLALGTAAARSDLCALGWQHVRGDRIEYRRAKLGGGGVLVSVPIMPDLAATLASLPRDRLTFLETIRGRPRDPNGLTEEMRRWCRAAGLDAPDAYGRRLGLHGLRKATARRLAEAGCSAHEIAAITGHASLREVERYARQYSRERAADAAMAKLTGAPADNVRTFRQTKGGSDGA